MRISRMRSQPPTSSADFCVSKSKYTMFFMGRWRDTLKREHQHGKNFSRQTCVASAESRGSHESENYHYAEKGGAGSAGQDSSERAGTHGLQRRGRGARRQIPRD